MNKAVWDIRRKGRRWNAQEAAQRYALAPEKLEMIDGKLLWSDHERLTLLGLLLENLGVDAAVGLGDPSLWRAAVTDLPSQQTDQLNSSKMPGT